MIITLQTSIHINLGEVRYHFSDIEQGPHQLTFKVWDVNNNSSMQTIDFIVQDNQDIAIQKVYNYPNPFYHSNRIFI